MIGYVRCLSPQCQTTAGCVCGAQRIANWVANNADLLRSTAEAAKSAAEAVRKAARVDPETLKKVVTI